MALLWGDSPQKQAAASLNQTIYELRQTLADADRTLLRSDSETLALAVDATDVDALEFARLSRAEDPAAQRRAAALYRGDLLSGFVAPTSDFEDWLAGELKQLDAPCPNELVRQVMLLIEGCVSLTLIHRDTTYVSVAAEAAKQLAN